VGAKCSGRLTWDVFVRNLACQLGTPSLWLPVDTWKEGKKGALAAVCTPTLKSASKKHQKLCTTVSEHREWHSEGGKQNCVLCIFSPSGKQPFSSPLCVASRLEQATRVYSGKIRGKILFESVSTFLSYPSPGYLGRDPPHESYLSQGPLWGDMGTSRVRLLPTGSSIMALKPPFSSLYCYPGLSGFEAFPWRHSLHGLSYPWVSGSNTVDALLWRHFYLGDALPWRRLL